MAPRRFDSFMAASVACLARLRNCDEQRVLVDNRVAIAEFRSDINFYDRAGQFLDVELANETGMVCRTAGNDVDLIEGIEVIRIPLELVHDDGLAVLRNALAHRIADCLRLLVDFLKHEVLVAALLGSLSIPVDLKDLLRHRLAAAVRDFDGILRDDSELAIVEDIGAARARDDGRDIRCDEVLALADADD